MTKGRIVIKIPRVLKVTEFVYENELRHTILLFPASKRTVGICLRYALDGFWLQEGKEYPFFINTPTFWKFKIGLWLIWIQKHFVSAEKK